MNEDVNSQRFSQESDEVFIREPGSRAYQTKQGREFKALAETLWECAVLSENIYFGDWVKDGNGWRSFLRGGVELPSRSLSEYEVACNSAERGRLALPYWMFWSNFPSRALAEKAEKTGLYVEVWEKTLAGKRTIAVVFKGTQFEDWRDWRANLRWFWGRVQHLVPFYDDQYTVVAKDFAEEFIKEFMRRGYRANNVSIITCGHSLGGGLAQQFAYSLPLHPEVPRVSHVCAFNPSPVTGWYSVDENVRTRNALGLTIDRIFEHGEALAYFRLLLSYLYPPSAANPSVREIRVNFVKSWNLFTNHEMRPLMCGLLKVLES